MGLCQANGGSWRKPSFESCPGNGRLGSHSRLYLTLGEGRFLNGIPRSFESKSRCNCLIMRFLPGFEEVPALLASFLDRIPHQAIDFVRNAAVHHQLFK